MGLKNVYLYRNVTFESVFSARKPVKEAPQANTNQPSMIK